MVEEVTLEPPQQGEVEVQIAACAIYQSDLHRLRGDWGGETPLVAGHQAAGVISAVGPGVNGLPANREAEVPINTRHLTDGRWLIGSLMGSTQAAVDIPRLVEAYRQVCLFLDELISQRYAPEDINAALDSLERGAALRNVIGF
ncbi:MAG: alcohol dehydrogenase catalytic domain-containing protein [Anaerolineales bacterium]|nr:alcohol dehydrogenase catalytic domain-containing protein [Anaerolineales bacterium]